MKTQENKAITLIALAITIIVLLILAGVSISTLTSQNGILNRTQDAKEGTENASDLEYLQTKAYEAITNYYATGSSDVEAEYILKSLKNQGISADENTGTITYNGKTYNVSEIIGKTSEQKAIETETDVKIEQITKSTATDNDIALFETGKIRMIIQEENNETLRAVIPNGFYYVTGAPSTGLVISDKYGDDDNNSKGGNQFVWVPCKGTGSVIYEKTNDASNKYGLASSWVKYKGHEVNYSEYKDWTDYGGDYESVQKYGGFYVARYEAGVPKNASFYVNTDGAEYIKEKAIIEDDYKPVSKKNNQVWNQVYQKTAITLSERMYKDSGVVKSQLMDSYAWDTITDWMIKEIPTIVDDSTGYGNYYDSGIKFNNSLYAIHQYSNGWISASTYKKSSGTSTGYTELATGVTIANDCNVKNKIKNIYDMAGNMWEWTTEVGNHSGELELLTKEQAENAVYAVLRGGSFCAAGSTYQIAFRHGHNTISSGRGIDVGFRVVLYIK